MTHRLPAVLPSWPPWPCRPWRWHPRPPAPSAARCGVRWRPPTDPPGPGPCDREVPRGAASVLRSRWRRRADGAREAAARRRHGPGRLGLALRDGRVVAPRTQVLHRARRRLDSAARWPRGWRLDPDVEYAEVDQRRAGGWPWCRTTRSMRRTAGHDHHARLGAVVPARPRCHRAGGSLSDRRRNRLGLYHARQQSPNVTVAVLDSGIRDWSTRTWQGQAAGRATTSSPTCPPPNDGNARDANAGRSGRLDHRRLE